MSVIPNIKYSVDSVSSSTSKIPRLLRDPAYRNFDEFSDDRETISIDVIEVDSSSSMRITCCNVKLVGSGSFGVVYYALLDEDQEVAIKKVRQDRRYKIRELQILKGLKHSNVVNLFYYFYSISPSKPDETFLNLVQEYLPQTLNRLVKHYGKLRQLIPPALVKLYSFQLLRGIAYIHHIGICHRDIKPQNLLIHPNSGILKICDFGSAKVLDANEPNVSYICSRYYRAPELIFGSENYSTSIDVWSAGCVIGELLVGRPLFAGNSNVNQLVEIIKVLGTPTLEQVYAMNPKYSEYHFPEVKGCTLEKIIRNRTSDSVAVLGRILVYDPSIRVTSAEILADSFFADLLFPPPGHPPNATGYLPSGGPAPRLQADFTELEFTYLPADLVTRIRECREAVAALALQQKEQSRRRGPSAPTTPIAVATTTNEFDFQLTSSIDTPPVGKTPLLTNCSSTPAAVRRRVNSSRPSKDGTNRRSCMHRPVSSSTLILAEVSSNKSTKQFRPKSMLLASSSSNKPSSSSTTDVRRGSTSSRRHNTSIYFGHLNEEEADEDADFLAVESSVSSPPPPAPASDNKSSIATPSSTRRSGNKKMVKNKPASTSFSKQP